MIIFDEVQKVAPGALDALIPGLEERASISTTISSKNCFGTVTETYKTVSTANTIFLFISDIGADALERQLIYYQNRSNIPHNELRKVVKSALDGQWKRLNFGAVITEVVPYLPLEQAQIESIFELKISNLNKVNQGNYWSDLVIDRSVVEHLSGPQFINYRTEVIDFINDNDDKEDMTQITRNMTLAVFGGRSLDNAGEGNGECSIFLTLKN